MAPSRAIVVVGMHRSGTSVLARGLKALGVHIGDQFLASRPDNPTGYWEDKGVNDLSERLLTLLGLNWESISVIEEAQWQTKPVLDLRAEAVSYLRDFAKNPLWGFKNPRIIRLFPFWRAVFDELGVDDRYIVAIRNPVSIAASLLKRQNMPAATAHLLSLSYIVPYFSLLRDRRFMVVDYDLLMAEPEPQLLRVARGLEIAVAGDHPDLHDFTRNFVDPELRHNHFGNDDFDSIPFISNLTRETYFRLHHLAADEAGPDSPDFWEAWKRLSDSLHDLIVRTDPSGPSGQFKFKDQPMFPGAGADFFAVIGAHRTGSNLLRNILNSSDKVAMMGEVLSPSAAAAHWDNYLRGLPPNTFPPLSPWEMESLLDRYFQFMLYRIRNHWAGSDKSHCRAIGIDIKYAHLRHLAPINWSTTRPPFFLLYLKARGATLIHTARRNLLQCAISASMAAQRNWREDDFEPHRRYSIDPERCLEDMRKIVDFRREFLDGAAGGKVVESVFEDLAMQAGSAAGGRIPDGPGPLRDIADALGLSFNFRYESRPRVHIPYCLRLKNHAQLVEAVKGSNFAELAGSLQ